MSGVREWVGLVVRVVSGGVLLVAGALKLPDPAASVRAVKAYDLLPAGLAPGVGYLLPVLEVVVGVLLIVGLLTRGAAGVAALLYLAFSIGIASAWARGLTIDCGCFGGGGQDPDAASAYPWDLARDGVLLLASVWLVWRPRTRLSLDNRLFPPISLEPVPVPVVQHRNES